LFFSTAEESVAEPSSVRTGDKRLPSEHSRSKWLKELRILYLSHKTRNVERIDKMGDYFTCP
jgi:hypothetical protein